MQSESDKEFTEVLVAYNVPSVQFMADEWKNIVVCHAQGKIDIVGCCHAFRV